MKKQRGSAILIAVLLVAAIGSIAFSFGRIFLIDAANATISENGIVAYYAAESGIEEGFLRYRYNRSAEVPFAFTLGNDSIFRSNLTDTTGVTVNTGTSFGGISKATTSISDNSKQYYDLRMGFIGTNGLPAYGQEVTGATYFNIEDVRSSAYGTGEYQFLRIPKDEAYKLDLSNIDFSISGNDIRIYAKYPELTDRARTIMYLKLTVDYQGDGSDVKEYKAIMSDSVAATCLALGRTDAGCSNEIVVANNLNIVPEIWYRDDVVSNFNTQFGARIPTYGTSKITLSFRPLFSDAYIGLSTYDCLFTGSTNNCAGFGKSRVIPGPFTYISSTGYFGGATRTVKANIDRQSGTLYDLFDYVIYERQ